MDAITANTLANEARRQEVRAKTARLEGEVSALAIQAQALSSANGDALRRLERARAELVALEAGAGPGLSADFGAYSAIDQILRTERFAGKGASIDAIKANPQISQADAEAAWVAAALAATAMDQVMVQPGHYGAIYRQQLHAAGRIHEATWEAQRAWIVATDKDEIMGI